MTNDLIAGAAARLLWVRSRMPLLAEVRERFEQTKPFAGHRIGMAMHLEPKTAVLLETLKAGGAEIVATGNLGSTQDDVVAYLRSQGMTILVRAKTPSANTRRTSGTWWSRNQTSSSTTAPAWLLVSLSSGTPSASSAAPKKPPQEVTGCARNSLSTSVFPSSLSTTTH